MNGVSGETSKEKALTNGVAHHPRASDGDKRLVTVYKECMKNHAAAIGGNARDGCGEFMPTSSAGNKQNQLQENREDSLKCSACGCHRNFHRKVIIQRNELTSGGGGGDDDDDDAIPSYHYHHCQYNIDRYNNSVVALYGPESSGRKGCGKGSSDVPRKKRFRTKFTEEQKEKMVRFAEEAGWGMQKLDGSVVDSFCQELGIKRRVLKVWMHNNKHKRFESS